MTDTGATSWILYHDLASLCSIMARYTYAIRGDPTDPNAEMDIKEEVCSLKAGQQLTEHFLCDLNANGEVPVLVPASPDGGDFTTIPDSLVITLFVASRYPSLLPQEHEAEIKRLIYALHDINFFSLTFAGKPEMQQRSIASLEAKLSEDISERYRKAIEHKVKRIRSRKLDALEPQNVQKSVEQTRDYLLEIAQLLEKSQTGWILNTKKPTALDAHVVVFICRLQDIHRKSLIPERVQQCAEVAMAQPAWNETMDGRRTMGAPAKF